VGWGKQQLKKFPIHVIQNGINIETFTDKMVQKVVIEDPFIYINVSPHHLTKSLALFQVFASPDTCRIRLTATLYTVISAEHIFVILVSESIRDEQHHPSSDERRSVAHTRQQMDSDVVTNPAMYVGLFMCTGL